MDEDNLTLYTLTLYTPGPTEERRAEVAIGFTAARERVRQLLSQEAGAERVGGADKQGETTDARTEAACAPAQRGRALLPEDGALPAGRAGRGRRRGHGAL